MPMKKGFFVSFEGIDSSGKKTQALLLKKALEKRRRKVKLYHFPAYNTTFGKHVAEHLRGEYWKGKKIVPEIAGLLYSIDRYQFKDEMRKKLERGEVILTDRFTQSAMVYHGAMFEGKEKFNYADWLERVESRLPQPNIVIVLDMPVEAAQSLIQRRKGKGYLKGMGKDIYEKKVNFQRRVRKTYLDLAKKKRNWFVIKCAKKVGSKWDIKKPENIHKDVWRIVSRKL